MQSLEDRSDLFGAVCYWDMLHLLSLVYLWGQIKHPCTSNAHAEEVPRSTHNVKAGTTEAILHLRETWGILPQDRRSCSLQLLRVIRKIQEANLIIQRSPDNTAL